MADTVSKIRLIKIAGVYARDYPFCLQEIFYFLPFYPQQRPDNRETQDIPFRQYSRKPQKPAAPQKTHQYRFSLVIQGMSKGDLIRLNSFSRLKKKIQTRLTGGFFQRTFFKSSYVNFLNCAGQTQFLGQEPDKLGVFKGILGP